MADGMRDVSAKDSSLREAWAQATVRLHPDSVRMIRDGAAPKGDPRPVARVAAILAAKATSQLVPYCHHVPIDVVNVDFDLLEDRIVVNTHVRAVYKTGVEIEALTAAAAAALNVFDLMKPVDDTMEILSVSLVRKTGGKSQVPTPAPFTFSILVASDRCSQNQQEDQTSPLATGLLEQFGGTPAQTAIVPDDPETIAKTLQGFAQTSDFVLVSGGTGVGPRDSTPEAILPLLQKRLHGLEHRILGYALDRHPQAMLGRPVAGTLGSAIVVAVPGSPSAVQDALLALFPYVAHSFHILKGGGHDL